MPCTIYFGAVLTYYPILKVTSLISFLPCCSMIIKSAFHTLHETVHTPPALILKRFYLCSEWVGGCRFVIYNYIFIFKSKYIDFMFVKMSIHMQIVLKGPKISRGRTCPFKSYNVVCKQYANPQTASSMTCACTVQFLRDMTKRGLS